MSTKNRSSLRPFLSAHQAFVKGEDSPRAFLERCVAVVQAREPEVRAFVAMDIEAARRAADASSARWSAQNPLSPIDGMPMGVKDIIETIDLPTGNGSPLFDGWQAGRDAAAVVALREAGAIILGKTVTTEFAATVPRETRNPWDLNRTPGGSSSGSAASVGCGMVSAALATQVVGSTIRPASYCGCFGFKPSVGAINRGGSLDYLSQSTIGVIAGSLADAWQVAREISARAGGDPGFIGLIGPHRLPDPRRPRRLAALETAGWSKASAETKDGLNRVLDRLANRGIEILRGDVAELAAIEACTANALALTHEINAWEWRWPLNTFRDRDASKLSEIMIERLAHAEAMTQSDYEKAFRERARIRTLYAELRERCDAMITLSAPDCAPEGIGWTGDPIFAVPASLLGVPAVTLPVLRTRGLPLGLQLVGFSDEDASLFSVAAAVAAILATDA